MEKKPQEMTSKSIGPEPQMVSLVRCEDYGRKKVFASVSGAIELLGGQYP